jgi:hypothetical protein
MLMQLHSIDAGRQLYTMRCGSGYSCYGFGVLDRKARAVADWLRAEPRYKGRFFAGITAALGTAEHFAQCAELLERGEEHNRITGRRCGADLVPSLIGLEGRRVEADYFGQRVRFWVGKSTGWMPARLAIKTRRSTGGEALISAHLSKIRVLSAS